ncbi:FliM/FliN family flagellar motor switch protein [bacterium]|nr:FliM/FliN family flagellar motor switch protein [bacterium]
MGNLNQSEIDELLNNLAGQSRPSSTASPASQAKLRISEFEPILEDDSVPADAPRRSHRLYDFRRPEKLSKDQARQLRTHFGLFWRRVANYLANLSRSSVEVELVELDQTTYKEIFTAHGMSVVMSTFQLAGEFQGMLKLDLSQVFSLIDRLMGGTGICSVRPRPLTEFERNLCTELFGKMLSFYAAICGDWTHQIENLETDERLLPRKLSADETMVRAVYDLRLGGVNGYLSLYVPVKSLAGVFGGTTHGLKVDREVRLEDISPVVARLRLPVSVILGETKLAAEIVANLKPGSVIALQQEESQPLKVTVGNQARFGARPGLVGNRMAVTIVGKWEAT